MIISNIGMIDCYSSKGFKQGVVQRQKHAQQLLSQLLSSQPRSQPAKSDSVLIAGGLLSLQDIERLSSKMQYSFNKQPTAEEKQHLAAQCDRLLRCYTTLCNSQPQVGGWAWIAEEPPGTTVGNLNQKVAQLEAALAAEHRCSNPSDCVCVVADTNSAVYLSASLFTAIAIATCLSTDSHTLYMEC